MVSPFSFLTSYGTLKINWGGERWKRSSLSETLGSAAQSLCVNVLSCEKNNQDGQVRRGYKQARVYVKKLRAVANTPNSQHTISWICEAIHRQHQRVCARANFWQLVLTIEFAIIWQSTCITNTVQRVPHHDCHKWRAGCFHQRQSNHQRRLLQLGSLPTHPGARLDPISNTPL